MSTIQTVSLIVVGIIVGVPGLIVVVAVIARLPAAIRDSLHKSDACRSRHHVDCPFLLRSRDGEVCACSCHRHPAGDRLPA